MENVRAVIMGAIGGNVKFEIIPTGIGDFLTVRCSCGATLNYEEL